MPTKYATIRELDNAKETVAYAENVEQNPGLIANIQDRKEFNKRKKEAQAQLDARQAPPPKDDAERTILRNRQEMLEAFIKLDCEEIAKPAMPSKQEMWETPAGAVGKHRMWEDRIKNYTLDPAGNPVAVGADKYGAWNEWKDNQRRLRGEEEEMDPDIANVERLRSEKADKSSFADYRKIVTAGSPQYKAKYDEVFPDHPPTPVEAKIESAKEKVHCMATKKNGEPCMSTPLPGQQCCRWHGPKEQPQSIAV